MYETEMYMGRYPLTRLTRQDSTRPTHDVKQSTRAGDEGCISTVSLIACSVMESRSMERRLRLK